MPQDDLNAFEAKLRSSLMPIAMSQPATASIHAMLDDLAGQDAAPHRRLLNRWNAAAAVAALIAAATALLTPKISDLAFLVNSRDHGALDEPAEGMHLVDESTRLSWFEDEGWLDDPDGGTLRAVRMRVVEENRLLDAETGIIVHVTSPREEMLLMPVSTF